MQRPSATLQTTPQAATQRPGQILTPPTPAALAQIWIGLWPHIEQEIQEAAILVEMGRIWKIGPDRWTTGDHLVDYNRDLCSCRASAQAAYVASDPTFGRQCSHRLAAMMERKLATYHRRTVARVLADAHTLGSHLVKLYFDCEPTGAPDRFFSLNAWKIGDLGICEPRERIAITGLALADVTSAGGWRPAYQTFDGDRRSLARLYERTPQTGRRL